ncbi:hypothetical protein V1477_016439 [Vespula maculifrons]|uniref:Uncharacterized protein n=1 Tax=Vespula maculifrons TaxID=7453 RepID=A0ABD2BD06_VESMC
MENVRVCRISNVKANSRGSDEKRRLLIIRHFGYMSLTFRRNSGIPFTFENDLSDGNTIEILKIIANIVVAVTTETLIILAINRSPFIEFPSAAANQFAGPKAFQVSRLPCCTLKQDNSYEIREDYICSS